MYMHSMETSSEIILPNSSFSELALTASSSSSRNDYFDNFRVEMTDFKTETMDCLVCGRKRVCSLISSSSSMQESEGGWAEAFCDLFSMSNSDILYILYGGYYCQDCQMNIKTIAKLKVELEGVKMCCEKLIRDANNVRSYLAAVSPHDQKQEEGRAKIYHYLNENNSIRKIATVSISTQTDFDDNGVYKIMLDDASYQNINVAKKGSHFKSSYGKDLVATNLNLEEDVQTDVDDNDNDLNEIGAESDEKGDINIRLDCSNDGVTDYLDLYNKGNAPEKKVLLPAPSTKIIEIIEKDVLNIATRIVNHNFGKSKTVASIKPKYRTLREVKTVEFGKNKLNRNKSSGTEINSIELSSDCTSDNKSILTDSDSDWSMDSESERVSNSKVKARESLLGHHSFTRAEIPDPNYRPTIFSDRNKVERDELRKKYKALIEKYGVKDFVIPVGRIPDFEDTDDEAEGRRRQCPIVDCTTVFYKKFKLIEHIKIIHQGLTYPYGCSICQKKFTRKEDFTDHGNTHTGLKPYQCGSCGTQFALHKSLKGHIRNIHGEKKFQCEQCGKCYHARFPYELHVQAHRGERPCTCELCGKSFKQMYDLRIHQRIHPEFNLDPLKCDICDKVYNSSHGLKIHMKVRHTGDLPFQCDICDYRAPYLGHLNMHKLRQHANRTFECDVCHRMCKSEIMLNHHKKHWCMRKPNGLHCPFPECGKGFKNMITLQRHEKIHKGLKKTFLCSACGKGFSSKSNLQRHFAHSHKEQNDDVDAPTNTTHTDPGPSWTNNLNFYTDLV